MGEIIPFPKKELSWADKLRRTKPISLEEYRNNRPLRGLSDAQRELIKEQQRRHGPEK